ncbi:MAG: nucleoside triphosphate pyrophosphohydrolase [Deltaproteobacteria bacterium]|nr:nucleoside triphosphate pyrophosphohydrolase [Deltaproteobacteria bacterium]
MAEEKKTAAGEPGTRRSAPLPPEGPSIGPARALVRLEAMLDGLLDPVFGCPWDKKQTTRTVTEDFLEEVYELRQALNENDGPHVMEEAGDVAFLLVFLGRLTQKEHGFGISEILDAAVDKMLARHPHVFGDDPAIRDMDTFLKKWHALKRAARPSGGVLDTVPPDLPALTRCHRLAQKASRSGFDFSSAAQVRETLDKELAELDHEIAGLAGLAADNSGGVKGGEGSGEAAAEELLKGRLAHEIGDVLATVVNLARKNGLSAEKCLDAYNRRFLDRFRHMEARLAEKGSRPEDVGMEELDRLWADAKRSLGQDK